MLFRQIIKDFELPSMSEEVVQSIHGVFCSFDEVEEQDEITHSPVKSLVVTLFTSKSPMRQSFLSMRVRVVEKQCSITCLLLEGKRHDLCTVVSNILARTASEVKRKELDDHIVKIEMETNTCIPPPVEGQPEPLFTKKLVFATRAVDEEIEAWRQLQGLLEDRNSICNVEGLVNKNIQTTMLNTVKFQLTHTKSRRTQIQGLRDRVAVQIELIHNMTAHKEDSQTTMIAIVALIFAPGSLIATIFSAGLFATDDHSWTTYIASTVPITLAIVVLAMLEDTELRGVYDTLRLSREGIYRWGFYLYRTTYDNQPVWERYISNLRQRAFDFIARDSSSKRDEMQATFRISVIEDRESLDGASIQEVLTRFQSWANALPDESDESQDIPANDSRDYARFNLCLYVDGECLSSLETSIPFAKVVNAETPIPDSEEEYSDSEED
ncbi:hypothetical protein K4K58_011088 [Colletotrichum sp. SAR11_239]|nr:hypothetical protein K4K58_011088 [Colletotrichum sp. SAR11_239]